MVVDRRKMIKLYEKAQYVNTVTKKKKKKLAGKQKKFIVRNKKMFFPVLKFFKKNLIKGINWIF